MQTSKKSTITNKAQKSMKACQEDGVIKVCFGKSSEFDVRLMKLARAI